MQDKPPTFPHFLHPDHDLSHLNSSHTYASHNRKHHHKHHNHKHPRPHVTNWPRFPPSANHSSQFHKHHHHYLKFHNKHHHDHLPSGHLHHHASSDKNIFQGSSHSSLLQRLAETRDDFPMWLYQTDEDLPTQHRQQDFPTAGSGSKSASSFDQLDESEVRQIRVEYPKELSPLDNYKEDEEPVERLRRYVGGELSLNVSLLHQMNTGLWFIAFYNDALTQTQVISSLI